jgi:hypothetical protein
LRHQTVHPYEIYHPRIISLHIKIANHHGVPMVFSILDVVQLGDYFTSNRCQVSFCCATKLG